ncbi:MAG TPA: hypothetical protein VGG06_25915 [Thermoanaerobaculia bacterium]|jgi:hypothetical protein
MDYKLLDHAHYSSPDHPPAWTVAEGDTVVLVFKGLGGRVGGYEVTEARAARVVDIDGDHYVAELTEPGMMIPVAAGERVRFRRDQAFQAASFGDETIWSVPEA